MLKLSSKSIIFIFFFIIISSVSVFYLLEYTSNNDNSNLNNIPIGIAYSIEVKSDKTLYEEGNNLIINGIINGANLSGYIQLDIIDPNGDNWTTKNSTLININEELSTFSTLIGPILKNEISGNYKIKAKYGNTQNTTSFFISTYSNIRNQISEIYLQNLLGTNISIIKTGDTVIVAGNVINLQKNTEKVSFNVEIRNESNILVHSGFISTNISPNESSILTVGWPEKNNGTYTVYAFVTENFENTNIISNIATMTFTVNKK